MLLNWQSGSSPVATANVTSVVSWDTANIDDDAQDDESRTGQDLDDGKNEFDLNNVNERVTGMAARKNPPLRIPSRQRTGWQPKQGAKARSKHCY